MKEYCLRALGKPVIDINVDDDQVDDRIDEAVQYFAQYHVDGVERMYLKYAVTADDVTRMTADTSESVTSDSVTTTWKQGNNFLVVPSSVISVVNKKEENLIKKYARKIPILKAGNMSLGINLIMYLTEIASKSLGDNFLSKVSEVHHIHKKDHPSGTALMLGKGIAVGKNKDFYKLLGKKYLNKKSFPYSKKINFNSIRKGEVIGEHKINFSSGKEIITLNHEAFDRALYSEGAFTAAKWLMNKKPGLYSMRDVLNFSQ